MKKYIRIEYTWASWEFGFGFGLPTASERFFMGTKLIHSFKLYFFFGPWTIEIGPEPIEIAEPEPESLESWPGDAL